MANLDLLVVNPGGTKKRVYQELSQDYSAVEPPFWAALTAGFVRKHGYNVNLLDANAENYDATETASAILDYGADLTNIVVYGQQPSASTQLMEGVSRLAKEIKTLDSDHRIILSGLHPSTLPERTLREEHVDYVAQGEGPYTVLDLVKGKVGDARGLWYEDANGTIQRNMPAPLAKNLTEEFSDISWDLLPMNKYKAHNWHSLGDLESREQYASMYTTLGCPYTCVFCCINAPFGKNAYRTWSPEWVLDQIDTLVEKYNVKNLKIIDELFVLKQRHFMPIVEGLIERDHDLNIWAYARIDTVKEEYLKPLKKAGFNWLALGIESGEENIRREISKGRFVDENIRDVVARMKKADINVVGNYIFGLPGDDIESMQQTLDLAVELNCEWNNFYSAMAYPGSELYLQMKNKGVSLPDDEDGPGWIGYSQHSYDCLPLPTEKISAAEVLRFRDSAFDTVFKSEKYLGMVEEKFGKKAREHIESMSELSLKRRILGD